MDGEAAADTITLEGHSEAEPAVKEDSAKPREVPSRGEWWFRLVVEALIVGLIPLVLFTQQRSAQDAETQREERRLVVAQEVEAERLLEDRRREDERARNVLRVEILGEWLPEFLAGEDRDTAVQMIIALSPSLAEDIFDDLRTAYDSAELLPTELETALNEAHEDASRAAAAGENFSVIAGSVSSEEAAERVVSDLEDRGVPAPAIIETGDQFTIVVPDLETQATADAVGAVAADVLALDPTVLADRDIQNLGVRVDVPPIYNLSQADAVAALEDAGFRDVVIWRVKSGSVAEGRARELVLNDGSSLAQETTVADERGVAARFESLSTTTSLALKISAGP